MSFLLSFPDEIVKELCLSFLPTADLVRLDSAYCGASVRGQFLHAVYTSGESLNSRSVVRISYLNVSAFALLSRKVAITSWAEQRGATIDTLFVSLDKNLHPLHMPAVIQPFVAKMIMYCGVGEYPLASTDLDVRVEVYRKLVARLPNLHTLELVNGFNAKALRDILCAQTTKVYKIALYSLTVRQEHLSIIRTRFPALTTLDISTCRIDSDFGTNMIILAGLKNLREVGMAGKASEDFPAAAEGLFPLRNIHALRLTGSVSANKLRLLGNACPKLTTFILDETVYYDIGAVTENNALWCMLHGCTQLNNIVISLRPFGKEDGMVTRIQVNSELQTLELSNELPVDVPTLLSSRYSRLHTLKTKNCPLRDGALHSFAQRNRALRHLSIVKCTMITDEGLRAVAHSGISLHTLELENLCTISESGVKILLHSNPNLVHLSLNSCSNISDAALQAVAESCPNLKTLDICGCANITDAALYSVALECPLLETLEAIGCTRVDRECWGQLREAFPQLTILR